MKTYKWNTIYGPYYLDCYNTRDLANLNNPMFAWNRKIKSYGDNFRNIINSLRKISSYKEKTIEHIGRVVALQIIREFIKLVIEDIVYNNDTYKFPNKLGTLQIGIKNPNSPNYVYNIYTQGKDYIPVLNLSREKAIKINEHYCVDFTKQWKDALKEEVEKGHQYEIQIKKIHQL